MRVIGGLLVLILMVVDGYCQGVLPSASGKYSVGITSLFFERKSKGESRQLNTWVYFPSKKARTLQPRRYLSDSLLLVAMKEEKYLGYSDEILTGWFRLKTSSYSDATPVNRKFPLIFILHGRGSSKTNYTLLAQELCSHGYVIAIADHPGSGLTLLKDGTKKGLLNPADLHYEVSQIVEDVRFLRKEIFNNAFTTKLVDQTNVGVVGHSLGAMAMFNLASDTADFKVTVNLDGYPTEQAITSGLHKPHLTLLGEVPTWISVPADTLKARRTRTFKKLADVSGKDFQVLSIGGMYHKDFNDLIFFRSNGDLVRYKQPIDSRRGFEVLVRVVVGYFDMCLKSEKEGLFLHIVNQLPEICQAK